MVVTNTIHSVDLQHLPLDTYPLWTKFLSPTHTLPYIKMQMILFQ